MKRNLDSMKKHRWKFIDSQIEEVLKHAKSGDARPKEWYCAQAMDHVDMETRDKLINILVINSNTFDDIAEKLKFA